MRGRAFSGVYWGAVASSGALIIQLAQIAILGRMLGVEDFGLMAMAMVALGIANAYADLGMGNAILTHQGITPHQLSSLYWLNWLVSSLAAGLVWLAAPMAAWAFGDARLEPLVAWLAVVLLVAPLGVQFQLLLQKALQIKPIALVEIASAMAGLGVSVTFASMGSGAMSLVYGNLSAAALKAIAFFLVGFRRWPVKRHFMLADVRPYFGFAAYQVGERTLNFAAWNLDKMLIGSLLGAHALGIYHLAYQMMQKPLQFVSPIVNRVALPLYASMSEDLAALRSAYLRTIESLGMLLFPVYLLMAVLAQPLILIFVGPAWGEAAPVLQWLSLLACLYVVGFPVGNLLLARKRADIAFWLNVWAIMLYALAVSAGSSYGIEGVAQALLLVQVGGLFTVGFWVRRKVVGMGAEEFLRACLPPLVCAAVAAMGAWLAYRGMAISAMNELAGGVLLATVVMALTYTVLLLVFMKGALRRLVDVYRMRNATKGL